MGEPVRAYGDPVLSAFDLDFFNDGRRRRTALGAGRSVRFEDVPRVRGFRRHRGDRSFPGWYYAVTTGGHVGYESRLERDRLALLDFAPPREVPLAMLLDDESFEVLSSPVRMPLPPVSLLEALAEHAREEHPDSQGPQAGSLDMTLPIPYDALGGDPTVRWIAGRRNVPRQTSWNRSALTEPVKARINSMIVSGMGPKEIWTELMDVHDTSVSMGSLQRQTARRHPTTWRR
ncbi:hypothetical protein [Streptomyces sp. SD31]|uniref:hypothetical protein n=1 Tax=Streptomyces sp. SD31 TaxID=3452208 RepID=UPI003F8CB510